MIRHAGDFTLKPRRKGAKRGNLFREEHNGPIYCRFFYTDKKSGQNKEVKRNTDKTSEKAAREVAWRIYQDVTGTAPENMVVPSKLRSTAPSLAVLVQFIENNRLQCFPKASPKTLHNYLSRLAMAVRLVTQREDWQKVTLNTLDEHFLHKWRSIQYRRRGLDFEVQAQRDLHLNANINSEWQDVKAIFSKQAMLAYKDFGFELPDGLYRMLAVPRLQCKTEGFTEIPPDMDMRMQVCAQAAIHRARGLDYVVPDGYNVPSAATGVIYEMARFAGLTQKEIVGFWRAWLAPDLKYIYIAPYKDSNGVNFQTKGNAKNGSVPCNPQRVQWWLEALGTSGEYLLPGNYPTTRRKLAERAANGWIAEFFGGDRKKRLHDLRKQAGSDVFKSAKSLTAAAAFLRDSEETARKYYLPDGHHAGLFGVVGL